MNNPLSLSTLFERFLKERTYLNNVSPRTIHWYQTAFKNYRATLAGGAPPLPPKGSLQTFVVAMRDRGLKPITCNTNLVAMNAFCLWLHREEHAKERVKLSKMRVEKRVLQLLDDTQMRVLVGYKPKTFYQWRTQLVVLLIRDTGLRISEALNLRHSDVDSDNLILKVFGKGQKERLVPFSPELRKRLYRLEQLKVKKGIRSDFVFAGFAGRWEKRNSMTSLYLLQRKLGLPMFGWHRLRHTFATNYLRHGGDIVRLSMVAGAFANYHHAGVFASPDGRPEREPSAGVDFESAGVKRSGGAVGSGGSPAEMSGGVRPFRPLSRCPLPIVFVLKEDRGGRDSGSNPSA